ncbi:translocation/assembly module TamB domain-containing protein [Rhizobium leguminosarum]|uniref:translocation/assembly module TamB domain-containing protein n=1 Tax=Rhizobium leguminosarum TaxID=384 RepID=UPI001C902959|nr:translocation/assembly module TamB domain-containing protein [Rhizobium leguminosarum]MBY2916455.1 filamentous hemagglutinin adherence factor [Rhizobium leguminosarum]MBY2935146.1 filamentous hemagglutinin adherence factor [Rhizobium leguminosarum]MBY2971691.1 filamentous hemagglutinin adherence factor [Rhizobium leguminosarum]MBY2979093.1 filamentous hemagglutinin adherence factor [Rhizobium leguminosarum]MBY3001602.1 filamentous hemagglutinin adherence factor [Rhizobium leguminosarum]
MQTLTKIVNWIVRLTGYAVGATLILAVVALAIFGFTSFGARIVTEKIASTLSNRDMTIEVREPQGLLTGGLRAAEISISDTRGVFAEIHGVAIDWNPFALLTGTFHAKRFEIEAINVLRKPVRTLPSRPQAENSGGFSLPIKVDVDRIALPDIKLAAPVAGRAFALAAEGSLSANGDGGEAVVNVSRHAVPDARLAADIAFAPAENRLRLKAQLSEPKGGLLAGFLGLPDSPAVNIDLDGQGPISDWKGKLQAALDGQQRAAIEARHQITEDGLHHLDLKGGGDLSSLLPSAFRPLFAGQTNIDLATTFDNHGKIDIQTGNIATGSVVIAASGTLDPAGNNSLNANLLGTSGPVDFRWPLAEGEARFLISGLNLALTGDAQTARLNVSGSLDTATLPQATIGNIKLTAKSDAFNLAARSGSVQLRLVAGDTTFTEPNLNRAVQGPVTIASPLQISPSGIGFNGTTVESANINGGLNGSYRLADKALTGNLKLTINPAALPAAVTSRFDGPISLESQVVGTIPSKFALSNLVLKSGTLEAAGNVALDGGMLNADLSGRLPDIGKLIPGASGGAGYALRVGGELPAISVAANLKAASLEMADRTLGNLNIDLSGLADPKAPQGRIAATGTIDGQPIGINGDISSQDGKTSIPALTADIGGNRLTGNVEFSPTLEPTAALTFDFPNVGLLAALGGQKADGDLKGSLGVSSDGGRIALKLLATGGSIRRDTLAIVKPDIDVTVSDLKALAANGTMKAEEVSAGTNRLAGLSLRFAKQQDHTDFDLNAAYDGNPVLAAGNIEAADGTMHLNLDRFSASPRNIPIELAAPTQVAVGGGAASLNELTLKTGTGSVTVTGSAGETLKLDADIRELPAALANGFVPNLSAGGTISGTIAVTGTPAAPVADFKLDWKDATTGQTKGAGLAPLGITAGGKFADNKLDFNTTVGSNDGLSLKAAGNVALADPKAPVLDVNADILNLPARIANGFVPDLAAEGTITGKVAASGSLAAPNANFDLDWKGAATSQTKRVGLADLGLKASGKFADSKLDFDTVIGGANRLSLKANGNVAITGTTIGNVKVDAVLANVPANIANSFVADLAAEGTISGKISATGSLSAPSADFDFNWKDAATSHTKRAGLAALGLTASGKFAENKLDFNAAVSGDKDLSLKAMGNVALAGTAIDSIKVDAEIAKLPASLANAFVPDLAAGGTISGTMSAAGTPAAPKADFKLDWADAATSQTRSAHLSGLALAASGRFADDRLDFDANLGGRDGLSLRAAGNIAISGTSVRNLDVKADLANLPAGLANGFVPGLAAEGTVSGTASASGALPKPAVDFKLDWKNAATAQTKSSGLSGLSAAASGKFANDRVDFDANLTGKDGVLAKATGGVTIAGTAIRDLSINADIPALPANIANAFVPGLGAEGTLSANAVTSGTPANPVVDFKLDWKDAATSHTKAAGLSRLALAATGKYAGDRLDFDAALNGGGGIALKAAGNLAIAGTSIRSLDVTANTTNLPAGIANGFVPGLAAEGAVSATVKATGALSAPSVDFKVDWKNAATSQTKGAGLSPFSIDASGKLAGNRLTVDTSLAGDAGMSLKGGGSVVITGNRAMDMRFTGNLPFAVLGAPLAQQGLVADGVATVNLQIGGTAAAPVINGTVSTNGAKLVDVRRNMAVNNLTATVTFNGSQAVISRLTGSLGGGGTISASGTIGIQPAGGFPADISIKLDKAVYVDGTLVVSTVNGTVGLRGPITNATLSGKLRLDKTSITVPEKLPTSLREIDIRHKNAPRAVLAQLRDDGERKPGEKSSVITLDLEIDAPSHIFVRGRGIDAELGGLVTIRGTAAAPIVTGGFTMRRGRMTILNRRLDFSDKSRITFAGDMTPALDMEATSASGTTTLTVDVAGLATDPAITFSSSPQLPQDEVLAQLIFGQSMSKLSPVQIAQLADAVSQLAGNRSTSLFEGLRNQLGVDDFDVSTDSKGQTSVSVGRYLNDRTYFELQQGGSAGAKAVINLDVGRGVKLRGGAGGNGEGEAGIVYEREY